MNVLVNGLPKAIEINGIVYEINPDYRTCLKIITAFEDKALTELEKQSVLINLLYRKCPSDITQALLKGIKFLNCGESSSGDDNGGLNERIYSFSYDEKYIYSAVDRVLNGRLSKGESVHWWEFVMAFMDLPEDCMMSKIIYYRMQFAKGKLSKEEKKVYYDNRRIFELPEELTAEEEKARNKFFESLEKSI